MSSHRDELHRLHAIPSTPSDRKPAPESFAARLKKAFDAAKPPMTQTDLAAAVEVTPPYIGYLIRGVRDNPGLDKAAELERVLGAPVGYLYPYWPDDDDDALTHFHAGLVELAELRETGALDLAREIAELGPADREKIEQAVAAARHARYRAG